VTHKWYYGRKRKFRALCTPQRNTPVTGGGEDEELAPFVRRPVPALLPRGGRDAGGRLVMTSDARSPSTLYGNQRNVALA
jgi:hypothetical protein